MMRRIALLALVALLGAASPAAAYLLQKSGATVPATSQVLYGQTTSLNSTADKYFPVGWINSTSPITTDTIPYSYMPVPGTFAGVIAWSAGSVGSGSAYFDATLYVNGSTTTVTCRILVTSPNNTCSGGGSAPVAAGDLVSWQIHPANNPSTSNRMTLSTVFTPTTPNDSVIFSQIQGPSNSTAQAIYPFSNYSASTPSGRRQDTVPDSGVIDKFYAIMDAAPGAAASGKSFTYYIDKLGAHSGTSPQISMVETVTSGSDLSHTISVTGPTLGSATVGNDITFEAVPANTPTAVADVAFSARYVPSTAGSFWIAAHRTVDTATATYLPITAPTIASNATEATVQIKTHAMTVTRIVVKTDTAPGAGTSRTYALRVDGVTSLAACTIANTDLGCSADASTPVAVTDGQFVDTLVTLSGAASTAGFNNINYLAHR